MKELPIHEIDPTDSDLLRRIGELRVRAWATEIPQASELRYWLDEYDLIARHWVAFDRAIPVAAARMTIHDHIDDVPEPEAYNGVFHQPLPSPIASINRLVVDPAYRRRGLGTRLDKIRIEAARESGCGCVLGETPSGEYRVHQLKSLGFVYAGDGPSFNGPNCIVGRPSKVIVYYFTESLTTENSITGL